MREIYQASDLLPSKEKFSLCSQLRRAAISIPSNIAEGHKRSTRKDYVHFLRIANGSSAELETQILLAKDLYPRINFLKCESLLYEVQRMLGTLIKKLES